MSDDSMLAQGTVEFRQAERDHANGRDRSPRMELVTLRGGPLHGMRRHARRGDTEARFQRETGYRRHLYRRGPGGVWRHVEEQA